MSRTVWIVFLVLGLYLDFRSLYLDFRSVFGLHFYAVMLVRLSFTCYSIVSGLSFCFTHSVLMVLRMSYVRFLNVLRLFDGDSDRRALRSAPPLPSPCCRCSAHVTALCGRSMLPLRLRHHSGDQSCEHSAASKNPITFFSTRTDSHDFS